MNPPATFTKTLFVVFIEEGRRKPAVDIRVVAKPERRSDQTVLSFSICNKALLIVELEGVKSATNRKASRGSSEIL